MTPRPTRERLQYLAGGVFGVDFFDYALKDAVGIEDEGAAEGAEGGLSVHFLLAPGAEVLKHLSGGIGKKREGEGVLGAEARVRLGAVLAHAYNVVSRLRESGVIVPERAGLGRASGRVVLGIEVDDGLLAFANEVLGPHSAAVLVKHLERRLLVSWF